jgi:hypothetical protein
MNDHPVRLVVALLVVLAAGLAATWFLGSTEVGYRWHADVTDVATHRAWVEAAPEELARYGPSFRRNPAIYYVYRHVAGADPLGYRLLNAALLVVAVVFAVRLFDRSVPARRIAAGLAVAANPFLLLVSSGPNWEIPLTVLVLGAALLPIGLRTLPLHAAIVVGAALFKDGAGPMLAGWIVVAAAQRRWGRRMLPAAVVALVAIGSLWGPIALLLPPAKRVSDQPRNQLATSPGHPMLVASERGLFDPVVGAAMVGVRWTANVYAAPMRAPIVDGDGSPCVVGWSLLVVGLATATAATALIVAVVRREPPASEPLWALVVLWSVAVAAGVLFVQTRYLLPVVPIALGLAAGRPVRLGWCAVGVALTSVAATALLALVGLPRPLGVERPQPIAAQSEGAP